MNYCKIFIIAVLGGFISVCLVLQAPAEDKLPHPKTYIPTYRFQLSAFQATELFISTTRGIRYHIDNKTPMKLNPLVLW